MTRSRVLAVVAAVFIMGSCAQVKADTGYAYQGNNYTRCGGTYCTGGPYALSVAFTTTLTGSALQNMAFTDITETITSFSFSDRSGLVFDSVAHLPAYIRVEIATDAGGDIISWLIGAYSLPADIQMQTNWDTYYSFQPGADFSETTANLAGNYGFVGVNPGTWITVPEPVSLSLLALGGLALRRRK